MSEKNVVAKGAKKMNSWLKTVKFILISYVLSVALIAVLSALTVYTDLPESASAPLVKIITFFGAFVSAFLNAGASGSRGWLFGALTGGLNIVILIILGTAFYGNNPFDASNAVSVLIGTAVGIFGGILGVNMKK